MKKSNKRYKSKNIKKATQKKTKSMNYIKNKKTNTRK